jgi:hypothetical protein
MALEADAQTDAKVDRLFVREAELFGELMDPDLTCHVRGEPFVDILETPAGAGGNTSV